MSRPDATGGVAGLTRDEAELYLATAAVQCSCLGCCCQDRATTRDAHGSPVCAACSQAAVDADGDVSCPRVVHLHLVDPLNIYRALCGLVLTRRAGDPQGHWWWHDEGHHSTRIDVPPGPAAVAARDGLAICPSCASHRESAGH